MPKARNYMICFGDILPSRISRHIDLMLALLFDLTFPDILFLNFLFHLFMRTKLAFRNATLAFFSLV